jgi:hypothetical protein
MTLPAVPGTFTDCCPVLDPSTSKTLFLVRNSNKTSNFIWGEVNGGVLEFIVENMPKVKPTTGCPGWWLFKVMMDHFQAEGTTVTTVLGAWTYGDNLETVNRETAAGVPLLEAIKTTPTWGYVSSTGYNRINVLPTSKGTPGHYTRIHVEFTQ